MMTKSSHYIDIGRNGEGLSPSALNNHPWPEQAPDLSSIPVNTDPVFQEQLRQECVTKRGLDETRLLAEANAAGTVKGILHILNHRVFQFNSRQAFATSAHWERTVADCCRAGRPIEIVLPIFCIIANPVKRFEATTCTLGEMVTLSNLADLSRLVSAHYAPGLILHIIVDSTFYAMPFGNTNVEAVAYLNALKAEIRCIKADDTLRLHDMSQVLAPKAEEFGRFYDRWRCTFQERPSAGISENAYESWLASMLACFNIKKHALDFETLKSIYTTVMPDHFQHEARCALAEYRAVKAAAAELQWERHFFPRSIRATIHTKELPVLGLRLYPEYKRRSRWLPYHGIALFQKLRHDGRYIMLIEPELFAASRPNVIRLADATGRTMGYLDENPYT